MNKGRYHWSNLGREVLFFTIHGVAAVPCFLLIFIQNWALFFVAVLTVIGLLCVRYVAKMTLSSALRAIVVAMTGREKATNNWFKNFIRQR